MLINRSKVKQFALEMAKGRVHKFTLVGGDYFTKCEENLKEFISSYIRRQFSKLAHPVPLDRNRANWHGLGIGPSQLSQGYGQ